MSQGLNYKRNLPAATTSTEEQQQSDESDLSPDQIAYKAHHASILDAQDYIRDAISNDERWASRMSMIIITCPYSLDELYALGHLPKPEGISACLKLVRVPHIHDEIAVFLWTHLATLARGSPDPAAAPAAAAAVVAEQRADPPRLPEDTEEWSVSPPAEPLAEAASSRTEAQWRTACNFCPPDQQDQQDHHHHLLHLHHHDEYAIKKCDATLDMIHFEALAATMGRVVSIQPGTGGDHVYRAGQNGSPTSSLKWYRESPSPSLSSRAPNLHRQHENLAARIGSAVGGFGSKAFGALGESLAYGYGYQPGGSRLLGESLLHKSGYQPGGSRLEA